MIAAAPGRPQDEEDTGVELADSDDAEAVPPPAGQILLPRQPPPPPQAVYYPVPIPVPTQPLAFDDSAAPPRPRRGGFAPSFAGSLGSTLGVLFGLLLVCGGLGVGGVFWIKSRLNDAIRKPDGGPPPAVVAAETQADDPTAPPPPKEQRAAAPGQAVVLEGLTVAVRFVNLGTVPLEVIGGKSESENALLSVTVELRTADRARKYNYRSWQANAIIAPGVRLRDNFGNTYKSAGFGFGADPVGHTRSGSVTAEEKVSDVLVFEKPVPAAEYLDLDLDGEAAGVKGTARFRIPKAAWAKGP